MKRLFKAYMRFNEEMHLAGVLVASEGLNPGRQRRPHRGGRRQALRRGRPLRRVEGTGGRLHLIEVSSLDEAQRALRAPSGFGKDDILEIRPLTGAPDLPPEILRLIDEAAPTWSAAAWPSRSRP